MVIANVMKNIFKKTYVKEALRKIGMRLLNKSIDKRGSKLSVEWCNTLLVDWEVYARECDEVLFEEAKKLQVQIQNDAVKKENELGMKVGGAGHYPLIYFLTRHFKPSTIIETGVAFGFSSRAFLEAIRKNGKGHLYSSDLPYFRVKNPELLIGVMVDDALRSDWDLYIKGDRENITTILQNVEKIDLVHYDSDKTYHGRRYIFSKLDAYFSKNCIVIMDDIQDNLFFADYVNQKNITNFKIFGFSGKYVGVIGV